MKKVLTLLLATAFALSLTACSENAPSSAGKNKTDETASEESGETSETVDVGKFTIDVPSNYFAAIQTDSFGEKDEKGNYPVRDDAIGLIKGGEQEWDAFSKPTIYVYYYDETAANEREWSEWLYEETEELDVTVNSVKCEAFQGKLESEDGKGSYVYDFVFYPIDEEKCIQFTIPVDMIDYAGMDIHDPDVVAIMESVKLK